MIGKRREVPPGPTVGPGVAPGLVGRNVDPADGRADGPVEGAVDPPPEGDGPPEPLGPPEPSNDGPFEPASDGAPDGMPSDAVPEALDGEPEPVAIDGLSVGEGGPDEIWLKARMTTTETPTSARPRIANLRIPGSVNRGTTWHLAGGVSRCWPSSTPTVGPSSLPRARQSRRRRTPIPATGTSDSGAAAHHFIDCRHGIGKARRATLPALAL